LPHVVTFLKEQGRMKFIRPLFRELNKHGEREVAMVTFEQMREKYHPIASKVGAEANELLPPPLLLLLLLLLLPPPPPLPPHCCEALLCLTLFFPTADARWRSRSRSRRRECPLHKTGPQVGPCSFFGILGECPAPWGPYMRSIQCDYWCYIQQVVGFAALLHFTALQ
jgi:hypothetical protein